MASDVSSFPAAIVLLNGPPRVGKDTAAAHLRACSGGLIERRGMADPLKLGCHAAHGLYDAEGRPLPVDAFESVKGVPRPEFFGLTPRQAYIAHSEVYLKQVHGQDIFGRMFLRGLEQPHAPVVVVPDSGFAAEAEPTLERIGRDRVLLIRLHADARGCTFAGDSRSHIDLPDVLSVDMLNDRDPAAFLAQIQGLVANWLQSIDDPRAAAAGNALTRAHP